MLKKTLCFALLILNFQLLPTYASNDDYESFYRSCSASLNCGEDYYYRNRIDSVAKDGSQVYLDDGTSFDIDWWYRSVPKNWKRGDHIFITFDFYYRQIKLEHSRSKEVAWGSYKTTPLNAITIKSFSNGPNSSQANIILTTSDGFDFKNVDLGSFLAYGWNIGDQILILANSDTTYQIWNIDLNQIGNCEIIPKNAAKNIKEEINFDGILSLEQRLNSKVIQQPGAVNAVATSLLIYSAGLKDKERPIGVFLFLGPTGVGKTELAKALAKEFYNDSSRLLRFDMSHFIEHYSITRLIGAPPGYIDHDTGGQLTEPLRKNSKTVVLLDEMEKAHPFIHKAFLPVFDEGYILDADNRRIDCSDTVFIMTSNLCGQEIAEFYRLGYSQEDILEMIEPQLIDALSPELYNRVEPVLFMPLEQEAMVQLVDLFLRRLKDRIWDERQIYLSFDESLKDFLIENGYHPLLGARPLNKLIEKRVVATLAYNIISQGIPDGIRIILSYDAQLDAVILLVD